MSRTISFKPEVTEDIQEAYDWYEDQTAGLGEQFVHAVDDCLEEIQENPGAFQIVFQSVRRALVRRFPYAIFYHVGDDNIVVIGCCHTSRDPVHWQQRV